MKNIILILCLLCFLVACAPELTIQGSGVSVGAESELKQCRILGSTLLSLSPTRMKLMTEERMEEHLIIEARNFAARIGGNMILPVDTVEEGKQSFKIYNCPLFE